jgi:hypothetical protein
MIKDVFLTLKSITYKGKSIGDDIRIEIEAIGETFENNYTIKRGQKRLLQEEIGVFRVDQQSFTLPVTLRIIERDTVLNDVGEKRTKLRVDLNDNTTQSKTITVSVKESRWSYVKPEAVFDLVFEIQVMESMRFVEETDTGWLLVKMMNNDKEERVSLPAFLRVRFEGRINKRDHFTVMEGVLQGQSGSVKLDKNNKSFLLPGSFHTGPIRMKYSKSQIILIVNGEQYNATDDLARPWNKGLYDIEIPDHPHKRARRYLNKAPQALVWFHIGHDREPDKDDENYIHTGQASLGCITITDHAKWEELYGLFIKARKGDSQSIGVLEVVD